MTALTVNRLRCLRELALHGSIAAAADALWLTPSAVVADRYGRLEPGYRFDAILLDEDPGDPRVFARPGGVTGVFKHGRPVVAHPRLADAAPVTPALVMRD